MYEDGEYEASVPATDSSVKKINFQSVALKKVYKYAALKKILDNIEALDFPAIFYQNNEGALYHLYETREELEKSRDKERQDDLRSKLRRYDPGIKSKYAIVIAYLLQVAEDCGRDLIYMNGLPYCFNGRYWRVVRVEIFQAFLSEVVTKTGMNEFQSLKSDSQKDLYKQFIASASQAEDSEDSKDSEDSEDAEDVEESKTSKVVINLKSNVFVCENGNYEFRGFDKNDMLTYCLDFDYDPNAKYDKFQKFLDRVLPNKNMQAVLSEYSAYILTKNLKLERCLILLGSGANGKSTFGDILTALLGGDKNVCYNSLSELCESSGYYRTELPNYLLNFCSEFSTRYSARLLKQLISTEPVKARAVFEKPITIRNYCKFIFNANVISKLDLEHSNGFHRRLLLIPFDVTIPERERDPELARKIIDEELSGIFNWILEGLERLLKNKCFSITPEIEAVRAEFERDSDSVSLFIDECRYVKDLTSKPMRMKDLFDEYWSYCTDSLKMKPVSRSEFKRRLKDNLGFIIKENGTNNYALVYCTKKPEELEGEKVNGMHCVEDNGTKIYFHDVADLCNLKNNE
jgi:putative DNA primase/helicase